MDSGDESGIGDEEEIEGDNTEEIESDHVDNTEQTDTLETTKDDDLTASEGPAAEFIRDVNSLIYDMVMVLYIGEKELSSAELKEMLSRSGNDFASEVVSILTEMLNDLGFGTAMFADYTVLEEYIEEMKSIGEKWSTYSKETLKNTLNNAAIGILLNGGDYDFYDFTAEIINVKLLELYGDPKLELIFDNFNENASAIEEEIDNLSVQMKEQDWMDSYDDEDLLLSIDNMFLQYKTSLKEKLEFKTIQYSLNSIVTKIEEGLCYGLDNLKSELSKVQTHADTPTHIVNDTILEDAKESLSATSGRIEELAKEKEDFIENYARIATSSNAEKRELLI